MNVTLLSHTPRPGDIVYQAARVCYSASGIDDLLESATTSDRLALVEKVLASGHHSVLEHVSFTFGIEGISRSCSHQLVRHRLASYSQQSQRYVKTSSDMSVVTPESIRKHPEIAARMHNTLHLVRELYHEMLLAGIPAEDARFVLPNAAETKLVMTMNARELWHFFELRCCRRAQWEIRALASQMRQLVVNEAPALFARSGPACLRGKCPEGSMGCGQGEDVVHSFAS